MISSSDIAIDTELTLGHEYVLVRANPVYAYDNNVPTQRREGTKYTIACTGRECKKIAIKVPGPQTVTLEEKSIVPVEFDELELYVYPYNGRVYVAGRAKAIRLVQDR